MLRLIKDKKNTKDEDKIWLYVPETPHNDPNSKWRKIDTDFLVQPDILKKQRAINAKIITFFSYIIMFLCTCIFLGIIKLLFFTKYETVYLDDGTYHSCVVGNESVEPYQYQ